ncbi:MAG: hypothetical protein ACKV2Q_09375 [Planctomycetaceae bacterium]
MIQDRVIECSFFVPIRRDANLSDGELHSTDAWEWLDDELFDRFAGRTIAPGLYDGFYRDPDTQERVADESRKFIVAVADDRIDELRDLLVAACVKFQQKCIYLSAAGAVEFIEAANHETT